MVEATAAQQAAEACPEPLRHAAAQLGLGNHTRSLVRLVDLDRSDFTRPVAALVGVDLGKHAPEILSEAGKP